MIEVISKLQEAVSKAAAEAEKEETVAAEAVDTVLAADSGALAEAEVEAAVRDDAAGMQALGTSDNKKRFINFLAASSSFD